MSIRRISSKDGITIHNIYESWTRGYLSLESGANNIRIGVFKPSAPTTPYTYGITTTFTYQAIRYI
jgi:hypothetical protein